MSTNYFVKTAHNVLFNSLIGQINSDIGRSIDIYSRTTKVDCPYCQIDAATDRSTGVSMEDIGPSIGKYGTALYGTKKYGLDRTWSLHDNYTTELTCPECNNLGYINVPSMTTVDNVRISDLPGEAMERTKIGYFLSGQKRISGELSDILSDTSDINSDNILATAIKIVIDSNEYRLKSLRKFGLKAPYFFEAIVERTSTLDLP